MTKLWRQYPCIKFKNQYISIMLLANVFIYILAMSNKSPPKHYSRHIIPISLHYGIYQPAKYYKYLLTAGRTWQTLQSLPNKSYTSHFSYLFTINNPSSTQFNVTFSFPEIPYDRQIIWLKQNYNLSEQRQTCLCKIYSWEMRDLFLSRYCLIFSVTSTYVTYSMHILIYCAMTM